MDSCSTRSGVSVAARDRWLPTQAPSRRGGAACAHTDTTAPEPEGRGLQPPAYGVPSPALPARAGRGFARFLALRTEDQDDGVHGGEDTQR
ncbi:hypothetical protein ACFRCI_16065 [Streptomyces sp. NPDC056638]|uniref:hypothetical protein n=1 Tax=Streptomyces sp. NPDC056638 TaxID=3345887 RepID=UPI003693BEFB